MSELNWKEIKHQNLRNKTPHGILYKINNIPVQCLCQMTFVQEGVGSNPISYFNVTILHPILLTFKRLQRPIVGCKACLVLRKQVQFYKNMLGFQKTCSVFQKTCSVFRKHVRFYKNVFGFKKTCSFLRKDVRFYENTFGFTKICSVLRKHVRFYENMFGFTSLCSKLVQK